MRDYQRQLLYDFENRFLFSRSESSFNDLAEVQAFTNDLWVQLDLDSYLRPKILWLRSGARGMGKFSWNRDRDKTQVKFNRQYTHSLTMSIVLHELAHAVQFAKYGDDGPTSHDEVFCRIYFELQSQLNIGIDLESLIADARSYGLDVWSYITLVWVPLVEKE